MKPKGTGMTIRKKASKLAALAVVAGVSAGCGFISFSSDGSTGGSGDSSTNASAPPDTSLTGWFEPAGTYEFVLEHDDGRRLEEVVHVGDPYRASEAPMPDPDVNFDGCEVVNEEPSESAIVFPVKWEFTNAADSGSVDGLFGVMPAGENEIVIGTGFAAYEDGSLGCRMVATHYDMLGGRYAIPARETMAREGFVYIENYFTPENPDGDAEGVNPRLVVRNLMAGDSDEWRMVEAVGPGVEFDGQANEGTDFSIHLPAGRTSETANAHTESGAGAHGS